MKRYLVGTIVCLLAGFTAASTGCDSSNTDNMSKAQLQHSFAADMSKAPASVRASLAAREMGGAPATMRRPSNLGPNGTFVDPKAAIHPTPPNGN